MIEIVWTARADDLPEALWQAAFRPPLEGLWWYRALEKSRLEGQFTFAYAGLKRDGEWIGLAPTFLMDLSFEIIVPEGLVPFVRRLGQVLPSWRAQRTLFVGSPCSEEGVVGLVPSASLDEVLPALQAALEKRAAETGAHMVVWKDFAEPTATTLRDFASRAKLFEVVSYPNTRIATPGRDFDDYLTRLSQTHRYGLRKKLKSSHAVVKTRTDVLTALDEAALAEVWGLFQQTYERSDIKFETLTPDFFQASLASGLGTILLVREASSGRALAFMLCFRIGDMALNKFIGLDYGFDPKAFLYFRLWEEFVRWALAGGAQVLQSGQTGYRAKLDVGHALVPLVNFSKHRSGIFHAIYALVGRSVNWANLDSDLKVYLDAQARRAQKPSAKTPQA